MSRAELHSADVHARVLHREPRFERVVANPGKRKAVAVLGRAAGADQRRRGGSDCIGPAAGPIRVELDADDALAALTIECCLHTDWRVAAEQPASDPGHKSGKAAPPVDPP